MRNFEEIVLALTKKSVRLQLWHLIAAIITLLITIITLLVAILGPDDIKDFLEDIFGGGNGEKDLVPPPPPKNISELTEHLRKEQSTPERLTYLKEHVNFIQGKFSLAELNSILDEFAFKEHKFEITQLLQSRIKDDRSASELKRFLNQFNNYQRGEAGRLLKGGN